MVEVTVDRILLNPIAEYRVVMLKEIDAERYLPIFIGPCEADAIAGTSPGGTSIPFRPS